jgi:hypothetical protein
MSRKKKKNNVKNKSRTKSKKLRMKGWIIQVYYRFTRRVNLYTLISHTIMCMVRGQLFLF